MGLQRTSFDQKQLDKDKDDLLIAFKRHDED